VLTSARPRTLVLAVSDDLLEVAMLGPRGNELGPRQVLPITAETAAVWAAIEQLGEFDRITLVGGDPRGLAASVAEQSQRPLRQMSQAAMRWADVIVGSGIEVALSVGGRFSATVFHDGVELGVDLGQQRVRKKWRVRDYLATQAFERRGAGTWRRRVTRTLDELLAVWRPTAVYLAAPPAMPMPELRSPVVVVPARDSLAEALRVWDAERD
jgi:hypothetical protein